MTTNYIQTAYQDVETFNDLAGNLTAVTDASVDHQASLVFEELSEVIEAIEAGDRPEILKEACDLFITVSGLLQKLVVQGYDVERALNRVNINNLAKFPKELSDDQSEYAREEGYKVSFNTRHARFVLKDVAGKVRKPLGFTKAYVADLIPKRGI